MTKNISNNILKLLVNDIKKSELRDNTVSLIVLGSLIYGSKDTVNDADFCIILRKRNYGDLESISKVFKKYYKNLDITVYYENELANPLPFRDIGTGCFAMHYFATGKSLVGKNIFVEKYKNLPRKLYRQSLKEKMFDYLLRLRRAFIIYESEQEMIAYFRKYMSRLLIDLMIYNRQNLLPSIIKDSPEETFSKAKCSGVITKTPDQSGVKAINDYLCLIEEITDKLLK